MKVTFSSILLLLISVTLWSFITSMDSKGDRKVKNVGSTSTSPVHESEGEKSFPKSLYPGAKIQKKLIEYYEGKHKEFAKAKKQVEARNKKKNILDRIMTEELKVFILLNLYTRNFSKGENVSYIENF